MGTSWPLPSSILAGLPCSRTSEGSWLCTLLAAGAVAGLVVPVSLPPLLPLWPLPLPLAGISLTKMPSCAAWACSWRSCGEMWCSCSLVWAACSARLVRRRRFLPAGAAAEAEAEPAACPEDPLGAMGWTSESLKYGPIARRRGADARATKCELRPASRTAV